MGRLAGHFGAGNKSTEICSVGDSHEQVVMVGGLLNSTLWSRALLIFVDRTAHLEVRTGSYAKFVSCGRALARWRSFCMVV